MDKPVVEIMSADQLRARRAEILERGHYTEEALRQLGAVWCLNPEEQADLDEIRQIDFLLGGS